MRWQNDMRCLSSLPSSTNTALWTEKIDGNVRRDQRAVRALREAGWGVMVIRQCELRKPEKLERRLFRFLAARRRPLSG
jgi:DNA mismatch endonuclease, patch repair protein